MTSTDMDTLVKHAIGKAFAAIGAELMAASNGRAKAAPELVAPSATPARRGRPRKDTGSTSDVVATATVETPVKRGPGRPRKVAPTPAPIEAGATPIKRGPGRPRAAAVAPVAAVDPSRQVITNVVKAGAVYHDAANPCGLGLRGGLEGKVTLTEGDAANQGMVPCSRCQAFKATSAA